MIETEIKTEPKKFRSVSKSAEPKGGETNMNELGNCNWCGDSFDPDSDRVRLRHSHAVFRRPMRSVDGTIHRVSGKLCCRCRNISRANVPDEIMMNEPVTETDKVTYYPSGNYELKVFSPGNSVTVKA